MEKFMLSCMTMLLTIALFAQSNDPILGKWENSSKEGRIEIFKRGDKYFGKLYWIKDSSKKDVKNPDKSKQDRKIEGLEILTNFTKKGNTYEGGEIYDPKSGKTYSCKMTPKGDKLEVRGFVGVSLLGRTEVFTRIK
ncbi:DUF2147 domain-containing protein [Sphingobacterium sp. lm-10]|uniref:DUF2147 domain-containing protein n=1 Tax=Sphingobacterium sp. lm-10 TaxID=2944904 RepID=UPI002020C158|nr:DUF2147 domain-containing protein [Sphingobacterium sp. lm-10]MCL7989482.1 DUF2147 domain-containing protein [Sphingobacterium sp. lm-10]